MSYLRLSDMSYLLAEGDIRIAHPEISADLTGDTFPIPNGYAFVEYTAPPSHAGTQYVKQITPIQVNGVWQMAWEIKDYTAAQIANKNRGPRLP